MYTRNAHPRLRDLPKRRAWPSRFITLRLDVRPREPITSVVQALFIRDSRHWTKNLFDP